MARVILCAVSTVVSSGVLDSIRGGKDDAHDGVCSNSENDGYCDMVSLQLDLEPFTLSKLFWIIPVQVELEEVMLG